MTLPHEELHRRSPERGAASQWVARPMVAPPLAPIKGSTLNVLTQPGDAVYCGYLGRYGVAGHYLNFGCGCFRASRQVYESLTRRGFAPPFTKAAVKNRRTTAATGGIGY